MSKPKVGNDQQITSNNQFNKASSKAFQPSFEKKKESNRFKRSAEGEAKTCFFCDQSGHFIRDCPKKKAKTPSKKFAPAKQANMLEASTNKMQVNMMDTSSTTECETNEYEGVKTLFNPLN